LNILDAAGKKGAGFNSLVDPMIDTTSPHGKLRGDRGCLRSVRLEDRNAKRAGASESHQSDGSIATKSRRRAQERCAPYVDQRQGTSSRVEKKCEYAAENEYAAEKEGMTGISSASMPILAVAIFLLLEDGALVVAASAAIEGKRHQTTTNHQSENDADTQERVAPTGQFNVARMRRPSLIGDVYGSREQ
jgi:hypothetical protein